MKQVVKGLAPAQFEGWKAQANAEWQPSYSGLQNPEKAALHEALIAEQGGVCCYCGTSISVKTSHIEHFRPQEGYEDLALEYENLHASCIRQTCPEDPLRCGHAKGNAFDETNVISPQEDGCERRFLYSYLDGAIYSADRADVSANYMVSLLRLDINFLQNRRMAALSSVFDDEFVRNASEQELELLASAYRRRNDAGVLPDFGHVVARHAEQILGRAV